MCRGQTDADLGKIKLLFTYEQVSILKRITDRDDDNASFFSLIEPRTDFIKFAYIGTDLQFVQKVSAQGGWKLHLAIDDTTQGNVAIAWNIVKDILIEQRIAESKVIKSGVSFSTDKTQCGKQVTIYQFFNPNRNWAAIINEIESCLVTAGIRPAQFSPTDKPIIGSRYITYHNDLSEDEQRAMRPREVMQYPPDIRYNPFGRHDPFVDIAVELAPPPSSLSFSQT